MWERGGGRNPDYWWGLEFLEKKREKKIRKTCSSLDDGAFLFFCGGGINTDLLYTFIL